MICLPAEKVISEANLFDAIWIANSLAFIFRLKQTYLKKGMNAARLFEFVLFKLSEGGNDIRQQDLHELSTIFAFPSVRQFGN